MKKPHIEDIVEPHRYNRNKPSLQASYPEVAAEWHYKKNCGFGPEDFSAGSNVYVWWKCERDKNHIWKAQICKRSGSGRDCPYCFGKNMHGLKVTRERSLAFLYPHVAVEWHPKKNQPLKPQDVLAGANTKVFWKCSKNIRHVWQMSIKTRTTSGQGCPKCYEDRLLDPCVPIMCETVWTS